MRQAGARLGTAAAVSAVALALPAPASAATGDATGKLLIALDAGASATAVATRAGIRLDGRAIPALRVVSADPGPVGAATALRRLRRASGVRYAVAEGRFRLRSTDPALGTPEPDPAAPDGTTLQWPLERARFPAAWTVTRGEGAVVAVVDTGIDGSHPDLQGKIAGAVDLAETDDDPPTTDADGHGTHVGSIACAATDNGIGIAGAGHSCRLLVVRTDLTDASVARALVEAADRGVHALNMSFGDDGDQANPVVAEAIDYAIARGVVLVAAAADEPIEEQGEPANVLQPAGTGADVTAGKGLSVTAATIDDRRASFAGRGSQVSLAAYGALRTDDGVRGLFALYPGAMTARERPTVVPPSAGCGCRASLNGDSRYAFLPGTSMAAPQVTAAAALVRNLNPDLGSLEVVRLLKETARRPAGAGWSPELGWGILDAGAAVEAARRIDRRAPVSRLALPRRNTRRRLELRWSGRDGAPSGLIPSGGLRYEVWQSVDGRRPRRIAHTADTQRMVRVRPGRRYAFFTLAVDAAGNREGPPVRPDLVVEVDRRGIAAVLSR